MKKIALVCALAGFAATASADWDNCWCITPYVGLDAQGRHVAFDNRFGNNLFKKDYPQGNAYVGFKFTRCFGLEFGYEWTKRMHRQVSLNSNEFSLGAPLAGLPAPTTIKSKAKFDGWHANLVGFLPITDDCCTELFGSVGIVQLRAFFERRTISNGTGPLNNGLGFITHLRDNRTLARANLGIQTKIVDAFGLRASIGWENTSKIRPFATNSDAPSITQVKARDSFIYGIGISYTFC